MKNLNLVSAIIFTIIYVILFFWGIADDDIDLVVGTIFMSFPVIVNWITWNKLRK